MKKLIYTVAALWAAVFTFAACSTVQSVFASPAVDAATATAISSAINLGLNALAAKNANLAPTIATIEAQVPAAVASATSALVAATSVKAIVAATGASAADQATITAAVASGLTAPAAVPSGPVTTPTLSNPAQAAFMADMAAAVVK